METNTIHTGDACEKLDALPENSIHAVVTDPPYGLTFMGRDWDDFEPKEYQEWCEKWATKAKRVLKPGGHLLAFSGNRTHHRLFSGVEDSGFEIRDTLTWHYGSGFPKALDVSKAIDKAAGAERETIREVHAASEERERPTENSSALEGSVDGSLSWHYEKTAPATDAAQNWDGWKTALKPSTEFIVLARTPFDGTVAENVQEHGTGALNIDETRIETHGRPSRKAKAEHSNGDTLEMGTLGTSKATGETTQGRYPANVVFDAQAAAALDRENEHTRSSGGTSYERFDEGAWKSDSRDAEHNQPGKGDYGGPSRYFYTSKASKSERTENGSIENTHPTVKPQDLMEWLVKLVTKEEQVILDPFAGSGTTCKAAKELNRRFIGIEKQAKWADVARVRCNLTPDDPSVVRGSENQQGLEAYND